MHKELQKSYFFNKLHESETADLLGSSLTRYD